MGEESVRQVVFLIYIRLMELDVKEVRRLKPYSNNEQGKDFSYFISHGIIL